MAKKSRRVRRKGVPSQLSEAQLVKPTNKNIPQAAEMPATEPTQQPDVKSVQQPMALDFRQEYRYVVSDLQRIGVLAAVILGILVVLSFIL